MGLLDNPNMEKPTWKYRTEQAPRIAVIIDDSVGTDLMNKRTAGLTKFIIAHRHWGKGLGCSVYMLVQSYCCHEGVARAIRENTCLLMLWKVKDKNQRAKIIEEAGLDVSEEQFFGMLDHCICEPYGFLCIDFQPKTQMTQFRKCFKTFLNPADFHKDVSTNSKVYFSAQLADNSSSTAATTTHPNMGWLQSRTVDSTGNIGTSGTATEWNDFVPQRSESLIWVGSLTVNQRVTFEIDVDNGWENDDASMKGCYTIVNVD